MWNGFVEIVTEPKKESSNDLDYSRNRTGTFCPMAFTNSLLISITLLLVIVCLGLSLYDRYRCDQQMQNLKSRIRKLEEANRQRLPYKSFEELLNAMAALDVELSERKLQTDFLENARGHIANAMKAGTKRDKEK